MKSQDYFSIILNVNGIGDETDLNVFLLQYTLNLLFLYIFPSRIVTICFKSL